MLPTVVEEPFDRQGWLFEVKWDGYRAVTEIERGEVRIISRRGLSMNARFPSIAEALRSVTPDMVIDGEIVALDKDGVARFQLLQDFDTGHAGQLVYYVFDLLYLDARDLRTRPLHERKELLEQVLPKEPNIRYSDHVWDRGRAFFAVAQRHGVEGVVAKDGNSQYASGRTLLWQKVKHLRQQEAVICGYTAPGGSRTGFGALVLGMYEDGELVYVGHAGTGFDEATLAGLLRRLRLLIAPHSPFRRVPATNAPVTWVRPELVCQVRFAEWTREGVMRQPVFLGLREDKRPEEVQRES